MKCLDRNKPLSQPESTDVVQTKGKENKSSKNNLHEFNLNSSTKRRKINSNEEQKLLPMSNKEGATSSINISSDSNNINQCLLHQAKNQSNDVIMSNNGNKFETRRRMISYGKNTAGYDEYLARIPRHKRKFYNPDHPRTPDPSQDISWRKFRGQVTAWRKKLHLYDPPDLRNNDSTAVDISFAKNSNNDNKSKVDVDLNSTQLKEIKEATQRGFLVNFNAENSTSVDEEKVAFKANSLSDIEDSSDDDLL